MEYKDMCLKLKAGEYDGVTIMQARLAIESLEIQLADLEASLPKVRADAVNLLIDEEMTVGRMRNDSMRSFIFVSDARAFADRLEAGNE